MSKVAPNKNASMLANIGFLLTLLLLNAPAIALVYTCNASGANTSEGTFKSGETESLCIHFLPYGVKVAFSVVVDDYIALSPRNAFYLAEGFNTDVAVQMSNSTRVSQQIVS